MVACGFQHCGPPQTLLAAKQPQSHLAPVEHGTTHAGRPPAASLMPRRAPMHLLFACRSSSTRKAGPWARGGKNLSTWRPHFTYCAMLSWRDARPQPLRGRQRLWRPALTGHDCQYRQPCRRA